jgi:hypothetical protein
MSDSLIKEITSSKATYQVADLPDNIKQIVKYYEAASKRVSAAEEEYALMKASINSLSLELTSAINKYEASLEEAVAEETDTAA